MAVHRSDLIDVLEFNDLAVAALVADEAHATAAGCTHGCADRSGVIDTAVRSDPIEDRVTTIKIEARTDAGEFERCTQEGLAQTFAVGREVGGLSTIGLKAYCPIRLTLIHEFHGENVAFAQGFAILADLLVGDAKAIAGLDVEHEVDIPLKNVGDTQRRVVTQTGVGCRLEQGAADRSLGAA